MAQKKSALNVLDTCEDEKTTVLWRHVWLLDNAAIKSELKEKRVTVIGAEETNDPIAISDTLPGDSMRIHICRIFNEKVRGKQARFVTDVDPEKIAKWSKQFITEEVGVYKVSSNDGLWFAGNASSVDAVVRQYYNALSNKLARDRSDTHSGIDEKFDNSFEHLSTVHVHLTQNEKAIFWIHNLVGMECLKKDAINLTPDRFDFTITVPDVQTKHAVEAEIRKKIDSNSLNVARKGLSFSPRVYEFLKRNEVHEYIFSKLNVVKLVPVCVWFHEPQNKITVYADSQSQVDMKCKIIQESYKEESLQVPHRYFSTEVAKQKMSDLETKRKGKLSLKLSKSYSTLEMLYLKDLWSPQSDIKHMYSVKTVDVSQKRQICRSLFKKRKIGIEEKYFVNIDEPEGQTSYAWVIKGEESKVKLAATELSKFRDSIKQETRSYLTDEHKSIVQSKVQNYEKSSLSHISFATDTVQSRTKTTPQNQIDVRQHIRSRSLAMLDGSRVTLYQCSMMRHPWLMRDSLVVYVMPLIDKPSSKMNIQESKEHNCLRAILQLPLWVNGVNQEREHLRGLLDAILDLTRSNVGSKFMSLSFDLSEVDKVKWPKIKYLKEILASVQRNKLPLMFLNFQESSDSTFEDASGVIHKWCETESGKMQPIVKISVVKGELAKQKVDVLVNSTSGDMKLDRGYVSNSLLKAAGNELQFACNRYLSEKRRQAIQYNEVVITDGYKLLSKYVFHGVLPGYSTDKNQWFEKFIQNCLAKAVELKMNSISFPALGTGKLGYPAEVAAKKMFEAVEEFLSQHKTGNLFEVNFVIFPSDVQVVKAFEKEENMRKEKGLSWNDSIVACTYDTSIIDILVAGESNEAVNSAFQDITDSLSAREDREEKTHTQTKTTFDEPDDQFIQREETDVPSATKQEPNKKPPLAEMENFDEDCPENTFKPDDTPQDFDRAETFTSRKEKCYVDVCSVRDDMQSEDLHQILQKYNIKQTQIVWNRISPTNARVMLESDVDANKLIIAMENEKKVRVYKSSPDAVVNIKATLNGTIDKYLQTEDSRLRLITQSGVGIEDKTGRIILTGDLTAISTARDILMTWKSQGDKASLDDENITNQHRLAHSSRGGFDSNTHPHNTVVSDTSNQNVRVVEEEKGNLQMRIFNDNKASVTDRQDDMPPITETYNDKTPYMTKDNESYLDLENQKSKTFETGNSNKGGLYPVLNTSENAPETKSIDRSQGAIPKTTPRSPVKKDNFAFDHSDSRSENNMRSTTQNYSDQVRGMHKTMRQNSKFDQETKVSFICPQDDDLMMITKGGIKVFVYKADICNLNVECIVNSSDSQMKHGGGLSKEIAKRAGSLMIDACKRYIDKTGKLSSDDVCATTAGNMSHYKTILHINAPKASAGLRDEDFAEALSAAVYNCLHKASKEGLKSIALPAISSGFGGIPKEVCFNAYPTGVNSYTRKDGKNTALKEIHFVDWSQDVIDTIQVAFLYAMIDEPSTNWKQKLRKIPQKTRELFKAHREYALAGKFLEVHLDNRTVMVICDGGLLNSLKHKHVVSVVQTDHYGEWKNEETAVVITEDVAFSGESKSSKLCLKRGGKDFEKHHLAFKKQQRKRTAGTLETYGDDSLGFYHVFYSILPMFTKAAHVRDSKEQKNFFKLVSDSAESVLQTAHTQGVKHLSMLVPCSDFYDCRDEWFLKRCIRCLIAVVREFAKTRSGKKFMVVHIVTNGNTQIFNIFNKDIARESTV